MKNYKLLMLTTFFALGSGLDAMPPRKERENSVPSATSANHEAAPAPASVDTLSNFAVYCAHKEELERQVDRLIEVVEEQEERFQNTTGRLQSEISALTVTHRDAMREKEERIVQISQQMQELHESSARSAGDNNAQIQSLMNEKRALETALANLEPKHAELVKCLERAQVTEAQKQAHDERTRRVTELLARVTSR
ncbi:MAG TPA: hypothetical protein DIC42_06035 [Holosporales bacterium]|nr:hypothetical protein [Holosporales bacterium]